MFVTNSKFVTNWRSSNNATAVVAPRKAGGTISVMFCHVAHYSTVQYRTVPVPLIDRVCSLCTVSVVVVAAVAVVVLYRQVQST